MEKKMTEQKITSLQAPLVKRWTLLRKEAAERKSARRVLIQGKKMVEEVARLYPLQHLLISQSDFLTLPIQAEKKWLVTDEIMKKITGAASPEGIAAELEMPFDENLMGCKWILCLDGVSDPGNLGTLLRTAFAFGWEGIFLLPGCADPYNDKALRAAMGATFRLRLQQGGPEELLKLKHQLQIPLYAADMAGLPVSSVAKTDCALLVLGSESQGISHIMHQNSQLIAIPMQGEIDSLNVAVAGGILLYLLRHGECHGMG